MAQSNCGRGGRMAPPGSNKRMGAKAVFVPRFCHHDTQGPPSIFLAQKTDAALTEQGMCSPLGGAGFEMFVESESFASGAEQRQKSRRQSIEQPQTIAPFGRVDADLSHAHAKVRILGIAEAAFYAPTFGIFL